MSEKSVSPFLVVEDVALCCDAQSVRCMSSRGSEGFHIGAFPAPADACCREDELEAWEDSAELETFERPGGGIVRPQLSGAGDC